MMHKAGLGVAFNAKQKVQAEAPCRINSRTLQDVLYILGLSKEEQAQLC
jgi:phosphoserine phosphatase